METNVEDENFTIMGEPKINTKKYGLFENNKN